MKIANYVLIVLAAAFLLMIPTGKAGGGMSSHSNTQKLAKLERDLKCLSDNVYYEARNQPYVGKVAVAFVTLNRVYHEAFDDNICEVVKSRTKRTCQFSWVCERVKPARTDFEKRAYKESQEVAYRVINNYNNMVDPTSGSIYFHATYVSPRWKNQKQRIVRIDDHIFYR